jgi:hypothetical protein
MADEGLSLERWANFYLITSAAAATLIGLLFVVITMAAERRPDDLGKIRLYLTPTVVYFASVLCLAALLTFPNQSRPTVTLCSCLVGAAGLVYSGSIVIGKDNKRAQYYEASDVLAYVAYPFAAYGLLVAGGIVVGHTAPLGLTLVAIGMLALLTLALRNSWAIAVEIVSTPPPDP